MVWRAGLRMKRCRSNSRVRSASLRWIASRRCRTCSCAAAWAFAVKCRGWLSAIWDERPPRKSCLPLPQAELGAEGWSEGPLSNHGHGWLAMRGQVKDIAVVGAGMVGAALALAL